MTQHIVVLTTFPRREVAAAAAQALVEHGLAACVQIAGPVASTYRWEGKVESAEEWLCLVKTRADAYDAVERAVLSAHPYDTPEILALPIVSGSERYLAWIDGTVTTRR